MGDLRFTRHPVDCGEGCISGRFGQTGGPYPASGHRGVDYAVAIGTPVYAPAAGKVVTFNNDGSFGKGVCLDHGGTPWFSLYAHLNAVMAFPGDEVAEGDLIGRSGNTGTVTGPHLHWQVCDTTAFPPDIARSTDPLAMMGTFEDEPSPEEFFAEVLALLGMESTPVRVAMLVSWSRYEGMLDGSTPDRRLSVHWNPLATTSAHAPIKLNPNFNVGHGPGNWNSVPVRVYLTAADGIRATADTIALDWAYPTIRACLRDVAAYPEAKADFRTWVGPEPNYNYGPAVLLEWRQIIAAAGATPPPVTPPATGGADLVLRQAMAMREDIRAVASNLDLPTVERAHAALVAAGVIPRREQ